MPKKLSQLAPIVLVCLLISGCSQKDTKDDRPEIALIMKSLANEFFQTMASGAETHQAEHAEQYDLIVNGIKNETDLQQQLNLVEQMAARGVDAMVIAPADSKALIPALKRAQSAGILIVNIDNRLDSEAMDQAGLSVPFVGPDNRSGAKATALVLRDHIQAGEKVAIIEGVPTAFNAQQRRLGFEDAMQEIKAEIVSIQSGNWEMAKANTIAASLLIAHPDLKAILCANDSMALGAVAAIEAAGRNEVQVIGFDNISAIQPMIKNGQVLATADQHGDQLAVYGIDTALAILSGDAQPEDKTTGVEVVTR